MLKPNAQAPRVVCDTCQFETVIMGRIGVRHIGFACPNCGESMLSVADYVTLKVTYALRYGALRILSRQN